MTSDFSEVPLALHTRLLQHDKRSTEMEKEQSEYASNKAFCKAVLLLGIANFCLMFIVNNHRLLTRNSTTGFIGFSNLISLKTSKEIMQKFLNIYNAC